MTHRMFMDFDPWNEVARFVLVTDGPKPGERLYAQVVEWRPWPLGHMRPEDATVATLTKGDAQALMTLMWEAGLRPRGYVQPEPPKPSAGELAATQLHLSDMRRLLGVDTPKPPDALAQAGTT